MGRLGAGRFWLIWAAVLPVLVWAVVRILGIEGGFPLIPLLAYTPYVAVLALLAAGLATALRNWAAALVAGLATVLLLAAVLPRAFGHGEDLPPGDRELRVLSANVHFGGADPAALVSTVERLDVDLLSLQEVTPGFAAALDRAGIRSALPNAIVAPGRQASGSALYTSLPLSGLPAPPPHPFEMPRAMVRIDADHSIRAVAVHVFPPKPGHVGLWRDGLGTLPDATSAGSPWLLLGDFNATLDFPPLRNLIGSGYRDAGDVTGRGLEATWPQGELFPPPVTIDHVLADARVAILGYEVVGLEGSDHRAIFARLGVPSP